MRLIWNVTLAAATVLAVGSVSAQKNAGQIMVKKPAELIEILTNPKTTDLEKAKACQRLAVVGTKDAVPALAALLADEHLNCYARDALEAIPGPAASEALREAATKLHGPQLIGVINSIGQRGDPHFFDLLDKILSSNDPAITTAASAALGRTIDSGGGLWEWVFAHIPEGKPWKTLFEANDPQVQAATGDWLLRHADRLSFGSAKDREEASGTYGRLARGMTGPLESGGRPIAEATIRCVKPVQMAAFRDKLFLDLSSGSQKPTERIDDSVPPPPLGATPSAESQRQAGGNAVPLEQQLSPSSSDRGIFNVWLGLIRDLPATADVPGTEAAGRFADMLNNLPLERQALLLLALADRKDPPPFATTFAAFKSKSPAMRKAAMYAMVKHGGTESVPILLEAASGDGEIAQAAKEGLRRLGGQDVDAAIVARLAQVNAKARVLLIELVGTRGIAWAEAAVRQAMSDDDGAVRLAAIAALGQIVGWKDTDVLLDRALADKGDAREKSAAQAALRIAVRRAGDRDGCAAKLMARLGGATIANQAYLLGLLGEIGGKKALETVVADAKSNDATLKDAATRTLGEWGDPDAAPVLAEIARNDPNSKYRIRALHGYIRIARQFQVPAEMRLAMFRNVMAIAERDEEKVLALDILTRIPSPETLDLAVSYAPEPRLRGMATGVAVEVADVVIGRQPQAVARAMRKLLEGNNADGVADHARQLIEDAETGSQ